MEIPENARGSGIYCIRCMTNDKKYVGQSKNLRSRIRSHLFLLRNNKHIKKDMQSDFNNYGEDAFDVYILEKCSNTELDRKEVEWMRKLSSDYNSGYYKGGGPNEKVDKDLDFFIFKYVLIFKKDEYEKTRPIWHSWVYAGKKHQQGK